MPVALDSHIRLAFDLHQEHDKITKSAMVLAFKALGWKLMVLHVVELVMQTEGVLKEGDEEKVDKDDYAVCFEDFVKLVREKEDMLTATTRAERMFRACEVRNHIELGVLLEMAEADRFPDAMKKSLERTFRVMADGKEEMTEDEWLTMCGMTANIKSPRYQKAAHKIRRMSQEGAPGAR